MRKLFKLKIENGKLKIAVGGVPPQSIREDTRIKELHQMPEYGIDAIFALYESKCILVGVALRLYFRREDIIRPTTRMGNGDIPYE